MASSTTSGGRKKPRWVAHEVRALRDQNYRELQDSPSPKGLLNYLLLGLGGESSFIPGLLFCGLGSLTDELRRSGGWTDDDVRRCMNVLVAKGMVLLDESVPCIYIPSVRRQECQECSSFGSAVEWGRCMENYRSSGETSAVFEVAEIELMRQLAAHPSYLASYLSRRAHRSDLQGEAFLRGLLAEQPINPSTPRDQVTERQQMAERYRRALPGREELFTEPQVDPLREVREVAQPEPPAAQLELAIQPEPAPEQQAEQVEGETAEQVLGRCWPQFAQQVGAKLQLRTSPKTWSGLPEKWQETLCEAWSQAHAAGRRAEDWELLASWVQRTGFSWVGTRAGYERYTPWMYVVRNLRLCFSEAVAQAKPAARAAAPKPKPKPEQPPVEKFRSVEDLVRFGRSCNFGREAELPALLRILAADNGLDVTAAERLWAENLVPA